MHLCCLISFCLHFCYVIPLFFLSELCVFLPSVFLCSYWLLYVTLLSDLYVSAFLLSDLCLWPCYLTYVTLLSGLCLWSCYLTYVCVLNVTAEEEAAGLGREKPRASKLKSNIPLLSSAIDLAEVFFFFNLMFCTLYFVIKSSFALFTLS